MKRIREFFFRFGAMFRKQRREAEMADELRHHLEFRAERNVAAGMSPEEARNAALKQFGGVEQIKEACRDEARYPWVEHFGQDARYAVRQLRKNRGFSVAAVIVLGLGIGANAAVFNLVHSLLFAPPNYAQPDEIVRVFLREKKNPKAIHDISYPLYREIHSQNGVFSGLLRWSPQITSLCLELHPRKDAPFCQRKSRLDGMPLSQLSATVSGKNATSIRRSSERRSRSMAASSQWSG